MQIHQQLYHMRNNEGGRKQREIESSVKTQDWKGLVSLLSACPAEKKVENLNVPRAHILCVFSHQPTLQNTLPLKVFFPEWILAY